MGHDKTEPCIEVETFNQIGWFKSNGDSHSVFNIQRGDARRDDRVDTQRFVPLVKTLELQTNTPLLSSA